MPKGVRSGKSADKTERVVLGADHAGFAAKERLKVFLLKKNVGIFDVGAHELKKNDDYPTIAFRVARIVASKGVRGILLCGSGQGVCIAANKISDVRATLVWNEQSAKTSRNDDDANVLCLPARLLPYRELEHIVSVWLATPFSGLARHMRRIRKLEGIPHKNQKR